VARGVILGNGPDTHAAAERVDITVQFGRVKRAHHDHEPETMRRQNTRYPFPVTQVPADQQRAAVRIDVLDAGHVDIAAPAIAAQRWEARQLDRNAQGVVHGAAKYSQLFAPVEGVAISQVQIGETGAPHTGH